MKRLMLLVGRVAYFVSLPVLKPLLRRGAVRSRVVVTSGDDVLLLKNWFSSGRWWLPGGGLHTGEDPAVGAARELREEIGVEVAPERLRRLTPETVAFTQNGLTFDCIAYHIEFRTKPELVLERLEVAEAKWVPRAKLASLALGPSVDRLLEASKAP